MIRKESKFKPEIVFLAQEYRGDNEDNSPDGAASDWFLTFFHWPDPACLSCTIACWELLNVFPLLARHKEYQHSTAILWLCFEVVPNPHGLCPRVNHKAESIIEKTEKDQSTVNPRRAKTRTARHLQHNDAATRDFLRRLDKHLFTKSKPKEAKPISQTALLMQAGQNWVRCVKPVLVYL